MNATETAGRERQSAGHEQQAAGREHRAANPGREYHGREQKAAGHKHNGHEHQSASHEHTNPEHHTSDRKHQRGGGFAIFLLLWSGGFISAIGSGLTSFGLGVYAYQTTGRASATALVMLMAFLPGIALGAFAGVLADTYDRRLLMVAGDSLSAIGLIYILWCLRDGHAQIWQMCLGVTLSSIFASLLEPAFKASTSDLLSRDQYTQASGMVQLMGSAKYLVSPVLAGILLAAYDMRLLLIIDIATLAVTVATTLLARRQINQRCPTPSEESSIDDEEALAGNEQQLASDEQQSASGGQPAQRGEDAQAAEAKPASGDAEPAPGDAAPASPDSAEPAALTQPQTPSTEPQSPSTEPQAPQAPAEPAASTQPQAPAAPQAPRAHAEQTPPTEPQPGLRRAFADGWEVVAGDRGIFTLVWLMATITFCLGVLETLITPLVLAFTTASVLGTLETTAALGLLATSIILGVVPIRSRHTTILATGLFAAGLGMVVFGLRENTILIGAAGFLVFAMMPVVSACADYLVRTNIPTELQGRAWGLIGVLSQLGYVAAYALSGIITDHIFAPLLSRDGLLASTLGQVVGTGPGRGAALCVLVAGLGMCAAATAIFRSRRVRKLEEGNH